MCRLYGFRANEPTKVECTLVHAQNALMSQSRADLRGVAHSDGWGIACYQNHLPDLERRSLAAFQDLHFSVTAERIFAETVVGHVRLATVGDPSIQNTHPFTYGQWTFAHNGTVQPFADLEPWLAANSDPDLWRRRQGTTDSEAVFYWLLSVMRESGLILDEPTSEVETVAHIIHRAVRLLETRSVRARAPKPAKLNFLLTNGRILVASRWRNGLHYVQRYGVHDCEICGIPHIHHASGTAYKAVVVASEPISHEPWREVPEGSVLTVDPDLRVELFDTAPIEVPP